MAILKKLFTFISTVFSWTERGALCLLLISMVSLACVQIFLRIFYNSGIVWADPLLRYMVIWAGLLGAVEATKESKHISIDIISHLVPESYTPWLRILINGFSAAVSLVLTYAAYVFVRDEFHYGGRGILDIPSWWLNIIYPLAFAAISACFLKHALKEMGTVIFNGSTTNQS